jgi:RsiW-degrading membrane proteinase PrsW (M82 family)
MVDRCRICGDPATHELGDYQFCDRHYARALTQRRSLWRTDVLALAAFVVFVAAVYALDALLNPAIAGPGLVAVGAIVAVIPAAIWLVLFYRHDRLEPEPAGMVVELFLLGALLAAAVGIPLVRDVFGVSSWLSSGLPVQLAGNLLIVGFVPIALVYLAVRLSVYHSDEFDEWTDGILYGTAAGLGYATILNIDFIVSSGGADLGPGTVRVALTALVLGSLGGLVGYFLGHDRLEVHPVWYVPLGVAIAAVLDGIFWYLRTSVTGGFLGGLPTTWVGLGLALVLAAAVTGFLARTVSREVDRELGAPAAGPAV